MAKDNNTAHSWRIGAVDPSPIWCSQLFLGRPGGLLQPAGLPEDEQMHSREHFWLERHCPTGPRV